MAESGFAHPFGTIGYEVVAVATSNGNGNGNDGKKNKKRPLEDDQLEGEGASDKVQKTSANRGTAATCEACCLLRRNPCAHLQGTKERTCAKKINHLGAVNVTFCTRCKKFPVFKGTCRCGRKKFPDIIPERPWMFTRKKTCTGAGPVTFDGSFGEAVIISVDNITPTSMIADEEIYGTKMGDLLELAGALPFWFVLRSPNPIYVEPPFTILIPKNPSKTNHSNLTLTVEPLPHDEADNEQYRITSDAPQCEPLILTKGRGVVTIGRNECPGLIPDIEQYRGISRQHFCIEIYNVGLPYKTIAVATKAWKSVYIGCSKLLVSNGNFIIAPSHEKIDELYEFTRPMTNKDTED